MPTKAQLEAQKLYANLLEEIKLRIASINHCTLGQSGLAAPFVKDFCYLQIRMICELVALGCLVAHGDIKEASSKNMQGAWSAETIMSTLEKMHPHFYPLPVKQTKTPNGFHLQAQPSPLPKDEFLRLYYKCGEMLHRGNLRKLLKGQFPKQINFPEITGTVQKLADLLAHHILIMQSGEQMFIAMLRNIDDSIKVQVAIAETPKGQPMDFASPNFLKDPP
jgi:hypothetical protein